MGGYYVCEKCGFKISGDSVEVCPECGGRMHEGEGNREAYFVNKITVPEVDKNLCVGCMVCADICPSKAIKVEAGLAKIDKNKCNGCKRCIEVCPEGAII